MDMDSFPDSISAKSSISFISSNRYQPALRICSILAFWVVVGGGAPDSISWAKPKMAFSGERNSWLMLDKNSDLAILALSAMERATSSSIFLICRALSS